MLQGRLEKTVNLDLMARKMTWFFLYRFIPAPDQPDILYAQYVYACKSLSELIFEEHRLGAADACEVASLASKTGFVNIELLDSWRDEPFRDSVNVFLVARRP